MNGVFIVKVDKDNRTLTVPVDSSQFILALLNGAQSVKGKVGNSTEEAITETEMGESIHIPKTFDYAITNFPITGLKEIHRLEITLKNSN